MPQLFVSYASVDRPRTLQIVDAVRAQGLDTWIDLSGIAGGTSYGTEIANALRDAGAVLLIASDASLASKNVRQEIMLAWRYDKPILPLILHPLVFPDDVAYWLEGAQWIEVLDRPVGEWMPKLWQSLARHGLVQPAENEPAATVDVTAPEIRGNLPHPLPPIFGREQAIEELLTLLDVTRAVTLTGTGGTGKTRLALEIGRRLGPSLDGGAWFVDLSSITTAEHALPALADALGVVEVPGREIVEGIVETLGAHRSLVIFDNLEQIPDIAPVLGGLLDRLPSLVLIATSRAPVSIPGEFIYPVAQLMLPDLSRLPAPAELLQNPAVQLFVERAKQAKPDFQFNDGNARPVAEICHRLDGLPLAIEIAAARTRMLPPAALLTRLGSRLNLITRSTAGSTRQQTLRNTIAWSYDLLEPEEQQIFQILSVFAGGASIEAAEQVAGAGRDEAGIIDRLEDLVDQNLLKLESSTDGEPRLRMLETIREYAREELERAGADTAARAAHADFYFGLLDRLQPDFNESLGRTEQQTIRFELQNVRDSFACLRERDDGARELALANAMFAYWRIAGPYAEAKETIERALEHAPASAVLERGDALNALGWLAGAMGDFGAARGYFGDALALYRSAERPDREAGAHLQLATAAEFISDYETAHVHQLERMAYHQSIGNELGIARVEQDLSRIAYFQSDYDGSIELGLRSLAIFRKHHDVPSVAAALVDVAGTEMLRGDAEESVEHSREAVRLLRTMDDRYGLVVAIVAQGRALQLAGSFVEAKESLEEGLALSDEIGESVLRALALYGLGTMAVEQGALELGRAQLNEALALNRERGDQWQETEVWDMLGRLELKAGAFAEGARSLGRGAAIRERLGTRISPVNRARYAETVEALRDALGAEGYDEAFEAGKLLQA